MALALMIVLAIFVWGAWLFSHVSGKMLFVNSVAFTARIQKLLMANSIDRAIKMCNATPGALLPRMAKWLLTRANKPHELLLLFHEAIAEQNATMPRERLVRPWWTSFYSVLAAALIAVLTPSDERTMVLIPGFVLLVGAALLQGKMTEFTKKLAENELYTRKVLHLLLARAEYVPPAYKLRKHEDVTEEDLAEWRRQMKEFEERLEAGDSPTEAHDKAVDDGLLPPH